MSVSGPGRVGEGREGENETEKDSGSPVCASELRPVLSSAVVMYPVIYMSIARPASAPLAITSSSGNNR